MQYIALAISAVIAAALTWRDGSLPTKVAVFLAAGAFIDVADIGAILLDLYRYRPGLLPEAVADARLGALLADFLFVPVITAVGFGAVRHSRLLVGVLLVGTVTALEHAFVRAGVFVRTGWKLWHSAVLFSLFSAVMAWWSEWFEREGYSPLNRAVVILCALQYTWTIVSLLLGGVLHLLELRLFWLPSPEKDEVLAGVVLYLVPFSLIAGTLVWRRLATRPAWVLTAGLIWSAWAWVLGSVGLRRDAPAWGPVQAGMVMAAVVPMLGTLDEWFARNSERAGLRH
ncbi:MAG TPA: hypothetical protein VNT75_06350 [Symbiobacteriaceae bacterium]|nr:hypothetical protein [Symbiobacteriaceae bacterium]